MANQITLCAIWGVIRVPLGPNPFYCSLLEKMKITADRCSFDPAYSWTMLYSHKCFMDNEKYIVLHWYPWLRDEFSIWCSVFLRCCLKFHSKPWALKTSSTHGVLSIETSGNSSMTVQYRDTRGSVVDSAILQLSNEYEPTTPSRTSSGNSKLHFLC